MLPLYGPYAAALSYIIGYSYKVDDKPITLYRGMSLGIEDLQSYQEGEFVTLNGFKSGSFDKEEAANFAF